MKTTTFEEFARLAAGHTFVPVCKEILADLLTPVSAFLKIAEHSDYAFLFESVEGGEHLARYSFLGKDPFLILKADGERTTVERAGTITASDASFLETLRRTLGEFSAPVAPGLPRFTGGAVGFLGYDAVPWFESVPVQSSEPDEDLRGAPTAAFMFFDTVLAFDHVQHRILLIANAVVRPGDDLLALYEFACARIGFLEGELERSLSRDERRDRSDVPIQSNMTRGAFENAVRRAKEHILDGDIYQVVLSQRFDACVDADPFTVYRALRHVNPSPYMFFIRMGTHALVGASPEMLVRVEGRRVETHPIAGTRPRGATEDEDVALGDELKANEKERAEHVMLVDLGRNDIGRISEAGSVRVPRFMAIERFSHVMHLVSVVEGRLAEGCDRLDALASCFPAGTVSGAPKIRAMEIIASLEPTRRGAYAGAVGYVDFAGNLDFCIAIRTVVMHGSRALLQAGAGIVADSDPSAEYEETCSKARALVSALEIAQRGL